MESLDFIKGPIFNFKNDVLETGFCLHLQVEPTHLDLIDRVSPCLPTAEPTQHMTIAIANKEDINATVRRNSKLRHMLREYPATRAKTIYYNNHITNNMPFKTHIKYS
jgi:hypothetical protein